MTRTLQLTIIILLLTIICQSEPLLAINDGEPEPLFDDGSGVLIEAEPDQNKYYSFSVDKMSSATISFTLEEPASGDHVIIDIYDENGFLNNDSLLSCELNTSTCEDVEYITNMNEEEARYYLAIRGNANIHIRKNEEKFEGIDPSTNKESIPLFLPIVIITGFILMIAFIAIIAFIILHLRKRK